MRILLLSVVALAGCQTAPPVVIKEPVEVKVPVPVPCLTSEIPKPKWLLDNPGALKGSTFEQGTLLLRELEQRRTYEAELEAALRRCIKKPK